MQLLLVLSRRPLLLLLKILDVVSYVPNDGKNFGTSLPRRDALALRSEMAEDFDCFYMPLDFLIIGFPQSGTSSLLSYLRQHPSIYLMNEEDTFFWRGRIRRNEYQEQWWKHYEEGISQKRNSLWKQEQQQNGCKQEQQDGKYASCLTTTTTEKETADKDETRSLITTTMTTTTASSKDKSKKKIILGIKDPLLALSSEVLHFVKHRVRDPGKLKILFAIRDPLSMMVSWMHAGTPWLMHWDDPIHLSVGLLHEQIQTSMKILTVPSLPSEQEVVFTRIVRSLVKRMIAEVVAPGGTSRQVSVNLDDLVAAEMKSPGEDAENLNIELDSKFFDYVKRVLPHLPCVVVQEPAGGVKGKLVGDVNIVVPFAEVLPDAYHAWLNEESSYRNADGEDIVLPEADSEETSEVISEMMMTEQVAERIIRIRVHQTRTSLEARADLHVDVGDSHTSTSWNNLHAEGGSSTSRSRDQQEHRCRRNKGYTNIEEFLEKYGRAFRNAIPLENFLYFPNEQLKRNPQDTLQRLVKFLLSGDSDASSTRTNAATTSSGGAPLMMSAPSSASSATSTPVLFDEDNSAFEFDTSFQFEVAAKRHVKLERLPHEFEICDSRLLPFLEMLFPQHHRKPLERLFKQQNFFSAPFFPDLDENHPCMTSRKIKESSLKRRVIHLNKLAPQLWRQMEVIRLRKHDSMRHDRIIASTRIRKHDRSIKASTKRRHDRRSPFYPSYWSKWRWPRRGGDSPDVLLDARSATSSRSSWSSSSSKTTSSRRIFPIEDPLTEERRREAAEKHREVYTFLDEKTRGPLQAVLVDHDQVDVASTYKNTMLKPPKIHRLLRNAAVVEKMRWLYHGSGIPGGITVDPYLGGKDSNPVQTVYAVSRSCTSVEEGHNLHDNYVLGGHDDEKQDPLDFRAKETTHFSAVRALSRRSRFSSVGSSMSRKASRKSPELLPNPIGYRDIGDYLLTPGESKDRRRDNALLERNKVGDEQHEGDEDTSCLGHLEPIHVTGISPSHGICLLPNIYGIVQTHEFLLEHQEYLGTMQQVADFLTSRREVAALFHHPYDGRTQDQDEDETVEMTQDNPFHDLSPKKKQLPPDVCSVGGDVLKHVLREYYCEFQAPLSCRKCCLEDAEVCWKNKDAVSFTQNVQKVMKSSAGVDVHRADSSEASISHRLHSCCVIVVNHMVKATTDYLKLELCGHEIGCTGWRENFSTP